MLNFKKNVSRVDWVGKSNMSDLKVEGLKEGCRCMGASSIATNGV